MTRIPTATVLMPVWNQKHEISTALASLLAQTFRDWSCVVVDDGSTDGSSNAVAAVDDNRIRYIRLPENLGRGAARQLALDNSVGRYVAMLDADDWWYPDKLDRQVAVLDDAKDVGAVGSSLAVEDTPGVLQGVWRAAAPQATKTLPPLTSALKVSVSHGAVLIRRDLATEIGYDPRLRRSEDRLFLVRALSRVSCRALGDPLYVYRPSQPTSKFDLVNRYLWRAKAYSRLVLRYPLSATAGYVQSLIQAGVALSLGVVGVSRRLTPRKPQQPTAGETARHRESWEKVREVHQSFWGTEA